MSFIARVCSFSRSQFDSKNTEVVSNENLNDNNIFELLEEVSFCSRYDVSTIIHSKNCYNILMIGIDVFAFSDSKKKETYADYLNRPCTTSGYFVIINRSKSNFLSHEANSSRLRFRRHSFISIHRNFINFSIQNHFIRADGRI